MLSNILLSGGKRYQVTEQRKIHNKIWKVCSHWSALTFRTHHIGYSCTHVIRGYCRALGHFCTHVIPCHCCSKGNYSTNVIRGHWCREFVPTMGPSVPSQPKTTYLTPHCTTLWMRRLSSWRRHNISNNANSSFGMPCGMWYDAGMWTSSVTTPIVWKSTQSSEWSKDEPRDATRHDTDKKTPIVATPKMQTTILTSTQDSEFRKQVLGCHTTRRRHRIHNKAKKSLGIRTTRQWQTEADKGYRTRGRSLGTPRYTTPATRHCVNNL